MGTPVVTNVKPALPLLTSDQESQILDAYRTLMLAIGTHTDNEKNSISDFSTIGLQGYELLAARSLKLLKVLQDTRKEEKVRAIRQGVKNLVEAAVSAHRALKEQFDAETAGMSDAIRKLMPKFPTSVQITMSDMAEAFPEGTRPEQMVVLLKDLSYSVGKGATGYYVTIPVPFTVGAV